MILQLTTDRRIIASVSDACFAGGPARLTRQWLVWLFCTRTFKLLPHLWNHPAHIIYVPAWIIFGYYLCVASPPSVLVALTSSALMKLYALFTLHETGWGTRTGIADRALIPACVRVRADD